MKLFKKSIARLLDALTQVIRKGYGGLGESHPSYAKVAAEALVDEHLYPITSQWNESEGANNE